MSKFECKVSGSLFSSNKFVSSAYMVILNLELELIMSFISIVNKVGPKIHPSRTLANINLEFYYYST